MPQLADQFCPNHHETPILAACFDPHTGTQATADAAGTVAVQRQGEGAPGLVFSAGPAPIRALSLVRGGMLLALGDDDGTVAVYRTDSGELVFRESREGSRGRVRAMRGVALSPEGGRLAAVAKDQLLRIWDLTRHEREFAWQGFSGSTVEFGPRGQRLLALDAEGQVRITDLMTVKGLYAARLPTAAQLARFTVDGTHIIAAGLSGVSVLRVQDGALLGTFATRGGSGIANMLLRPDGAQAGLITKNSVHVFSLPDLQRVDSTRHGAPEPTGAAMWTYQGVRVAGSDGRMHAGGDAGPGGVAFAGGFGRSRVAVHRAAVTVWQDHKRTVTFPTGGGVREAHIDRDGRLVVLVPEQGPVRVHNCKTGKEVFDTGKDSATAKEVAVGGTVVAVQPTSGGVRWWDLGQNLGYQLQWPQAMALSNGGTWLGVVTPKGRVRVLDPATGKDALPAPVPLADNVRVRALAFVNRRPDLLVLDEEGVLGHYDLSASARGGEPAQGEDVVQINGEVDRVWGITGGRLCALRLQEEEGATILWVDLAEKDLVGEVTGLHRQAWVDAENGLVLEPGKAGAIVERGQDGTEQLVYRVLSASEWVAFGWRGVTEHSPNFASAL